MSSNQTRPTGSIGPASGLTAFQRDLLAVVERLDKPHGLAIKDVLEEAYEEEVFHGRLYPNLDDLVDEGLLSKGSKDRRTNSYTLTGRGQRELDAHRRWLSDE